MKQRLLLLFFMILINSLLAQENSDPTKGTIKVEKRNHVAAILFDNVNNRLVGKDIYGNILDSAVVSFDAFVTVKGIAYQESFEGDYLSKKFSQIIYGIDQRTVLFFTNIKVREKDGSLIDWPKFSVKLGGSYEGEF